MTSILALRSPAERTVLAAASGRAFSDEAERAIQKRCIVVATYETFALSDARVRRKAGEERLARAVL